MATHLELTIKIAYDLNGATIEAMEWQLDWAAQHLFNEGFITDDTEATVDEWSHEIRRVDAS